MDKEWHREYSKKWYQENKDKQKDRRLAWQQNNKEKQRAYSTKSRHGISIEDYYKALVEQGSICAICQEMLVVGKNCHLDHCHTTGKFRGFLCDLCNKGLGAFKDNCEILTAAIKYLETSELTIPKIV